MADPGTVAVEVGWITLQQVGWSLRPKTTQHLDLARIALLILNDKEDVRYEVVSKDQVITVKPAEEQGDCVLVAAPPTAGPELRELVNPSRLFHASDAGRAYPRQWFQTADASQANGRYNTAFALVGSAYSWSCREDAGGASYLFQLPVGVEVYLVERGPDGKDVSTRLLPARTIDSIVVARKGGPQQDDNGWPWPPK